MEFDLNNLVRESVRELKPYSSARDEYISDGSKMVFLDANESPYPNGINRYPDPHQRQLKTILAKQYSLSPANILIGNGSDEVLDLIFRAFCEPQKDNVITMPPTYGMYKVLAGINAIENKEVLLNESFELNVDKILEAINSSTKAIFLCSPNNPTGNSFSVSQIETLLNNFSGLLVVDEAYIDFATQSSWLERLGQFPNLIVTRTFSKAHGMAGLRLGVCYGSAEVIAILNRIKPPYNVNELTQQKALQMIQNTAILEEQVAEILRERDRVVQQLEKINFIKEIYPSDANFILVKVDDANRRYNEILELGVVVRNRSTQPLCDNTLRFTIGTPEENKKLLKVLNSL
ncbi:histidinol-phosphate transaminase [uncultured Eudoraea sp.]|uniref:histidinol-phosphate transaminase n=1 Tax=uncultured Eudoraea sp. TaxID=1035614 RepID=UPI002635CAFD|nr:histidinol-phosphate transaminase [uncultured Eudoraea sp.]